MQPVRAQAAPLAQQEVLPPLQVHPLPPTLAQRQETAAGNYFDVVKPTPAGYLIWSRFPVKVYVEPASALQDASDAWARAVEQAIQDWSLYLPLERSFAADTADIQIRRSAPPLQLNRSANRANEPIARVRSAETRYEIRVDRTLPADPVLAQRFTISLSPRQTGDYIRAAARHELGHALGIWGHSPVPTDVMYYAQVRNPPPISDRDVNTLRQIYEQPTRLGWSVLPSHPTTVPPSR